MPILHGANLSPYVRKVRIALAEKGMEVEQNPIIPFGLPAEYLKKSPLGKIPCYECDDGTTIPDSSVIIDYLEQIQPEPRLYPTDPKARARALFYEEYADTRLVEAVAPVFFQRFVRKNLMQQEPDEDVVREAIEVKQPAAFGHLEEVIGEGPFFLGEAFSVADIAIASPFVNLKIGGETLDAKRWPRLAGLVERVWSRKTVDPIVKADLGG